MKGGQKSIQAEKEEERKKRWIREQKVMIKRKMKAEKITLNLEENLRDQSKSSYLIRGIQKR